MAAFRPAHHPGGAFLPYITLDFSPASTAVTSREAALALLRPLAAAVAVPGQGVEAQLQHVLLQALLEQGLVEQGGRFGLRSVAFQQAGEAMLRVLPSSRPDLAAVYRTPGLALADLMHELHAAGLLASGHVPGKQATYYSASLQWLQPYGRRGAAPSPPAQHQQHQLVPPPSAQPAARQPAASGAVQVTLHPRPSSGKPRVSRANAVNMLKFKLTQRLHGSTPTAQLLQLLVACLLAEGLEKVDTLTFCQHPVSLKAARKALEQQLHLKGQAVHACYRSQFGSSLLSLLQAPELAGLVRLQGLQSPAEDGWQQAGGGEQGHVQLLLRPSAVGSGLAAAAAAPGPAAASSAAQSAAASAVDSESDDFEGWSFSVEEETVASAAAAMPQAPPPQAVPLPQPPMAAPLAAAPAAAAASGAAGVAGQVTVRTVTSETAAGAAVAALLSAPGGCIGMACEDSGSGRDPSALTISLFAPGVASTSAGSGSSAGVGSSTCYVFDLAAMPPQDRRAAVRLLAAVLENQQLTKVLHDCRWAAQALFSLPGRSIEMRGICDTQVAHGLAQFLSLLGTEDAADGVDEPVPLLHLLELHHVPQPGLGGGATAQATHAAAAAAPLLVLRAALEASLGPLAAARLPALSRAFSRWDLDLAAYTAVPRPPRQWLAHLLELAPLCM